MDCELLLHEKLISKKSPIIVLKKRDFILIEIYCANLRGFILFLLFFKKNVSMFVFQK
jgi:hypothetical protein